MLKKWRKVEIVRRIQKCEASVVEVREFLHKLRSSSDVDKSLMHDYSQEEEIVNDVDFGSNLDKVWQKVESQINENTDRKPIIQLPMIMRVAAAIVIIVAAGLAVLKVYQIMGWTKYQTYYGEIKTIELDDGSIVILNGNSVLKVPKVLSVKKPREVFLKGEANFHVARAGTEDGRFVVHTKDLDVEVLGTRFNVNSRKDETSIYLEEGSVKVRNDEHSDQDILLSPGDKIEYSAVERELKRFEVESEINEISWRSGMFEFEELPLDQILKQITQPYNYTYQIVNSSLLERRFTLRIPNNDLDFAISVLEKLTGISIVDTSGKLIVRELD